MEHSKTVTIYLIVAWICSRTNAGRSLFAERGTRTIHASSPHTRIHRPIPTCQHRKVVWNKESRLTFR